MATGAFSREKTLPSTLWGCGNGMAMALPLTTDEDVRGVYFQSCCLFGDRSTMQNEWANDVSGTPNNFEVNIKSQEKTQAHL